jgi:DNA-binding CsgD family transcriptional regulator
MESAQILPGIALHRAAETDLEAMLVDFLGKVVMLCNATGGAARLVASDGRTLRLAGSVGVPRNLRRREDAVPLDCGVCGVAARTRELAVASDVAACARRSASAWFGSACTAQVAVPLVHGGRLLGVCSLFLADGRPLPASTLTLLRGVGALLGFVLDGARRPGGPAPVRALRADDDPLAALTAREREILAHVARGASNKAIARSLDISYETVKMHVRHILAKLRLASRVEAAVLAVEHEAAAPVEAGVSRRRRGRRRRPGCRSAARRRNRAARGRGDASA